MRLKLIILSFIFIHIISPACFPINSEEYLRYVEKADSCVLNEEWESAEKFLRQALKCEPANPGNQLLLTNMGMILTAQGKYGEAIRHLDTALTLNPGSFLAYKNRGMAYSAMMRLEDACNDFSKALEIDSLDINVRCLRATVYAYGNRIDKASKDYSFVLGKDRDNVAALEGMATCCLALGKHDEAIPFLNRLIEIKPEPEHYFTRGLSLAYLGRFTEASEDSKEGLLLDPSNGNLWLLRAYIEKTTYRHNEAKNSLEKARKFGADRELEYQLLPNM